MPMTNPVTTIMDRMITGKKPRRQNNAG
jgi:hypothetical protein